jgi:hypothetical protein
MSDLKERATQLLTERLQWLADQVRANHENAGQVASGKLRDYIHSIVEDQGDRISGYVEALSYIEAMEQGNAPWEPIPTKQAKDGHTYDYVPKWFADAIGQWMSDKGIQETKERNRYAVAWKIIHDGTLLYRQGGRSDIYSEITKAVAEEIADELAAEVAIEIQTITLNLEK